MKAPSRPTANYAGKPEHTMNEPKPISGDWTSTDGRHRAIYRLEGEILTIHAHGPMSAATARELVVLLRGIVNDANRPVKLMLHADKLDPPSAEARAVMSEEIIGKRSPFAAMAVIGGSLFVRTMMNLHARIAHIPLRAVASTEDAMAWLGGGA